MTRTQGQGAGVNDLEDRMQRMGQLVRSASSTSRPSAGPIRPLAPQTASPYHPSSVPFDLGGRHAPLQAAAHVQDASGYGIMGSQVGGIVPETSFATSRSAQYHPTGQVHQEFAHAPDEFPIHTTSHQHTGLAMITTQETDGTYVNRTPVQNGYHFASPANFSAPGMWMPSTGQVDPMSMYANPPGHQPSWEAVPSSGPASTHQASHPTEPLHSTATRQAIRRRLASTSNRAFDGSWPGGTDYDTEPQARPRRRSGPSDQHWTPS